MALSITIEFVITNLRNIFMTCFNQVDLKRQEYKNKFTSKIPLLTCIKPFPRNIILYFLSIKGAQLMSYKRGNQKTQIKEGQTTQYPQENRQMDKHTIQKANDWTIRIQLKTGGKLGCSERVSRVCSTSDTCYY